MKIPLQSPEPSSQGLYEFILCEITDERRNIEFATVFTTRSHECDPIRFELTKRH